MRDLLKRLFPVDIYTDPVERRQALGIYIAAAIMLVGFVVGVLLVLLRLALNVPGDTLLQPASILRGIVVPIVALAALYTTRRGQRARGALIVVGAWFALAYFVVFFLPSSSDVVVVAILVGISLSGLLIGGRTPLYTGALSGFVLIIGALVHGNAQGAVSQQTITILFPLVLLHTGINYLLSQGLRVIARQIATQMDERRIRLAGVSGEIAQRFFTTRLDLDLLVKEIVRLVQATFADIDQAQLYLVDKDRKVATLAASTHTPGSSGGVGDTTSASAQQIAVGSLGIIGRVTISGERMVVRDTDQGQVHRRAAFLPGTRTEVAFPLRVGNETLGVLDLQSRSREAFSESDIEILETLVNQIAIAIDNAQLYAEVQSRLAENQKLYDQTRVNLREIERLNQQLIGGAWAEYLRGSQIVPAYTVDLSTGQVEDAAEWTQTLAEASRRNQVVIRPGPQTKVVSLPISVRGQVIGAMEFEIAPDQEITPEQMAILQQVVERLGLASENARLLEEAQRIAQREALVNEISARLQATTSVETVVAAATQSLADAFQAPRVAIRLGTPTQAAN
jgi:GAF domain-containing protein